MLFNVLGGNLSFLEVVAYILSSVAVIFITMPIHEFAHGFTAAKLGDPTPRYQGRLTLNPLAHIDYMGALAILVFGIGWAKPVQVNPRYFRNSKWGMALVALAGPVSNIVLGFIALLLNSLIVTVLFLTNASESVYTVYAFFAYFLVSVAQISVYLAVFNLIPVPPFDGSRILFTFLPQKYYFKFMQYERYIFVVLLALIYIGVLDKPIDYLFNLVFNGISALARLPFTFITGV